MVCLLLQISTAALRAFEKLDHFYGDICIGGARQNSFDEHTGCYLKECTRWLKETIHCREQLGRDQSLEQAKTEV